MNGAVHELRRAQPWLGTLVSIRLSASDKIPHARLDALMDQAFAAVSRVHERMSYHASGSTLTCINRYAARRPVQADPDTLAVLQAALGLAAASHGAFDPTVAGQLEDWGYLPRHEAMSAGAPGGWEHVEVDTQGLVRLHRPLRIDLGGIAKGYAVDQASEALCQPDIDGFVVNAGGDLRVGGAWSQTIWLRDPRDSAQEGHRVELQQGAIATSGSYLSARCVDGREVSHLVDAPRASPFLRHGLSVSVRAPCCMQADALTKVVLFAEPDTAQALLARHEAQAIVLHAQAVA